SVGRVLLPAGLATAASRKFTATPDAPHIPAFSLVRDPAADDAATHELDGTGTVIIHRIGDVAAIPLAAAEDHEFDTLPLGRIGTNPDDANAAYFVETRLHAIARRADMLGAPGSFVTAELGLRGPTIPDTGYPGSEQSDHLNWDDEGYLRTAISGKPSAIDNARLVPGSPLSDVLSVCGLPVSAGELDALCCAHHAIADAAVVSAGDTELGTRLCALIVPKAGETVTLDDLAGYLHGIDIAPHKIPIELRIVTKIPRDTDGRILRFPDLDRAAA
ncbi:MAG: hypothetical protein KDJ16_17870, partial [Hyphomicrobiales bacterium]|nr:hypothetical protein [Hyphomicrobiales bacterium]